MVLVCFFTIGCKLGKFFEVVKGSGEVKCNIYQAMSRCALVT